MALRDHIDVAKMYMPEKVDLQKLLHTYICMYRNRPNQLWIGRQADLPTGNVALNGCSIGRM